MPPPVEGGWWHLRVRLGPGAVGVPQLGPLCECGWGPQPGPSRTGSGIVGPTECRGTAAPLVRTAGRAAGGADYARPPQRGMGPKLVDLGHPGDFDRTAAGAAGGSRSEPRASTRMVKPTRARGGRGSWIGAAWWLCRRATRYAPCVTGQIGAAREPSYLTAPIVVLVSATHETFDRVLNSPSSPRTVLDSFLLVPGRVNPCKQPVNGDHSHKHHLVARRDALGANSQALALRKSCWACLAATDPPPGLDD